MTLTTASTAASAHVRLAAASGCSPATFAGIFGAPVDQAEYKGWRLAMSGGAWTATRGQRTLRADTLGGIYGAVDKATRKRSPAASTAPPSVAQRAIAFEACDGEGSCAHRCATWGLS